jgi:hypothetical protein
VNATARYEGPDQVIYDVEEENVVYVGTLCIDAAWRSDRDYEIANDA